MSIRPPHRRYDRPDLRDFGPFRPARRFKVVLHRDPGKDLTFVTRVVMEVTRFGPAEAEFRMWEAHHRGRCPVLVTHFERAELYAQQFADRGLAVSIEPE